MEFEKLGLSPIYAARLKSLGIVEATWIQQECFESVVEGRSVMGLAKTGTGKTLAFLAPLVERLHKKNLSTPGAVVVLLPTRELALQVAESLQTLLGDTKASVVMVGGQAEDVQLRAAKEASWWIATPGRFLDLLRRRQLPKITELSCVILDEADRLLDMGFLDDIRAIFKQLPPSEQALFFSATLHFGVEEMAFELGFDFVKKGVAEEEATAENLDHSVVFLGENEKFNFLNILLHKNEGLQAIIFSNYKDKSRKIAGRMRGLGARAECLNADLQQNRRIQIVEGFKKGEVQYLVASDLAARGIDILDLDLVVNYDLPEDPSIYVHRVGRTARAGKKGKAVSFVGFEDTFRMERIEKFLGVKLEKENVDPDFLAKGLTRWKTEGPAYESIDDRPQEFKSNKYGDRKFQSSSSSQHSKRPQHSKGPDRPKVAPTQQKTQPVKAIQKEFVKTPPPKPTLFARIIKKLFGLVIIPSDKTQKDKKDPAHNRRKYRDRPELGVQKHSSRSRNAGERKGSSRGKRGANRSRRPSSGGSSSSGKPSS
ncbi:DEAD/DEAH box helicase [bacterium]|nr:DEAD/DEAH box helicase [bacterium]